jgi:hypothetical protein
VEESRRGQYEPIKKKKKKRKRKRKREKKFLPAFFNYQQTSFKYQENSS